MNTSKQVNVMIGLLFLAFVGFAAYIATEPARAESNLAAQKELHAYRGADLYVQSCANCHGTAGEGTEEGGVGPRLRRNAFLILAENNPWGGPETPAGDATETHDFLFNSIACGRAGTIMPLWSERYGGPLSETQIGYIVTMMTEGRWDLVDQLWHEYEEHNLETNPDFTREGFMIAFDALDGLPRTAGNCGQYPGTSGNEIRTRDPFAEGPAVPVDPGDNGDSGPDLGDGPSVVMLDIDFAEDEITIPAGEAVEVPMVNQGVLVHDISIDSIPITYDVAGGGTTSPDWDLHVVLLPGESATVTMTVSEPGVYDFYCSVPGHREGGLVGTLIVE